MKKLLACAVVIAALATSGVVAQSGGQRPAAKAGSAPAAQAKAPSKVDTLVAAMTLDEKLSMLYGATDPAGYGEAGYIAGVPRLNIPPLRLTDGPAGIRTAQPATAMPAPVAMASTFSVALAEQFGKVLGQDARARHQNVVLAPMVNIVRVPQGGRNFETLGEDPLLASRLVAAETRGIQGEGVIATIKHYAFNNQENARNSVSAEVDERTGREIYLPGFEASIKAGAGSVMASYNRVNGTYAAEHPQLLTDVLRKDWGFKGFVMSDWGATHSAAPALKAGMEMEMPNGRNYSALADLVKKGELPESVVNVAVARILTAMEAAGLLAPDTRPLPEIPTTSVVARDIAIAGSVLLKNQGNVLPLSKEDAQSIAVIGPTAKVLLFGGGGSSAVRPMHKESPLEVLQKKAGPGARITYAKGYDLDGDLVPSSVLRPEATINIVGGNALPAGTTFTWNGTVVAPKTGDYILKLQSAGGRGSLLTGAAATAAQQAAAAWEPWCGWRPAPVLAARRRRRRARGREARADKGPRPPDRGAAGAPTGMIPVGVPGFGGSALLQTADGLSNASTPIHLEAGVPTPISHHRRRHRARRCDAGAGAPGLGVARHREGAHRRGRGGREGRARRRGVRVRRGHRGARPRVAEPAGDSGQAGGRRRGRESAHHRRDEQRRAGADAVGRAGRGDPPDVVSRAGGRRGHRVDAPRRGGARRTPAGDLPEARRRRADREAGTVSRRGREGRVLRRDLRRVPLVRPGEDRAAVPVRLRPVVHDVRVFERGREARRRRIRRDVHAEEHRDARRRGGAAGVRRRRRRTRRCRWP